MRRPGSWNQLFTPWPETAVAIARVRGPRYTMAMKNWVFLDLWTGGVNPAFSMIHHVAIGRPEGDAVVMEYLDVSSLDHERQILTALAELLRKTELLYMRDAAFTYLRDCMRQYHMAVPRILRRANVSDIKNYRYAEFTGELKTFFKDYKDYYYLPAEDTAIHKSVGEFVDKKARVQATARTAYIKKTGSFLPVYDDSDAIFTAEYRGWPRYSWKKANTSPDVS